MSENYDSNPPKKGLLDKIFSKFKGATQEVAEKVNETVSEVKDSDFGEKVSDVAKNIGDKAKDVISDVKESEIVDKIGDAADSFFAKAKSLGGDASDFCSSKIKSAIGKINFDKTLETLKEKQQSSGKDLSKVIDFVEKLQNVK
ncbi:MAG: hypothetical protein SPL42_04350 [Bacteroidales bacterium]|nr:hypothetical protein [Bacteroidales bacterium]MDY6347650.1 hypothetical protein [Bacteroidales bacterium]